MGLTRTVGQTVIFHGKSDIGMVREENQDAFCIHAPENSDQALNKGLLLVLADGMGGLAHGSTASQMAVSTVRDVYYKETGDPGELLMEAAREGNQRIFAETERLPGGQPMGSTLTALVLLDGCASIAHVGDSRAYRFSRDSGLQQLTRDHTLVQELADRGEIEQDSLPYLLHRNVLTRGLGLQDEVEVDLIEVVETKPGDTFLLCSDGLYDVVTDAEIESRLVAHGSVQTDLVDDLIELARSRGAPDNVTVLVARIESTDTSRAEVAGDDMRSRESVVQGVEVPAFGFLPRSLFVPISYFVAFALGALLTLSFQSNPPTATGEQTLEERVRALAEQPRVESFDRGQDGFSLKGKLLEFLTWLQDN